jgi:hypothetical protein
VSAELSPLASGGLAGGSGVVRLALGAQALTCGQISESLRSIDLASVMSHRLVEVAVLRIQVPVVGSRGCSRGLLRAMLKDIEIVLAILMAVCGLVAVVICARPFRLNSSFWAGLGVVFGAVIWLLFLR